MSGNFSPSTAADMIAHFENAASPLTMPFYYENSTNTINFGYGSNLTGAETSALNGNATLKNYYDSWLKANGVSLTAQQWTSFASSNLTSANGPGIAANANSQIGVKDWTQAALSVLNSYVQTIVDPALESNISGFSALPADEKIAFENLYYDHKTLLGAGGYGDISSGDLSGAAEELAFASEPAHANQSGLEERFLGSGVLALNVTPTYNSSNIIVSLDASQSNTTEDETFLNDVLTSNQLGHDGETAYAYVSEWGSGPSASLTTIVSSIEQYLLTQGMYVASTLDEIPSVNTTNISFSQNKLTLYNAKSYSGVISGFQSGTTLDLANVGTASAATISSDNVLSVTTAQGSVNLKLATGVDYTKLTPTISSDGHGGSAIILQPGHTITFSEYPVGTLNPQYTFSDDTVSVIGQIVEDGAQPASPAAAADPDYTGPVFINFANPVQHVSFDAGYFDDLGSTTITYIGAGGAVLSSSQNSAEGIVHYDYSNASGISAINVVNTGFDDNGFSVDTVEFDGAAPQTKATSTFDVKTLNAVQVPGDPIFTFEVTRSGDLSGAASVGYAVTDAGANPVTSKDFSNGVYPVGHIDFAPGESSKLINVDVLGDFAVSNPKTFALSLIAPSVGTSIGISAANATTLTPPTINGTVANQLIGDASATPFATVSISDPNSAQTEVVTVQSSNPDNGSLSGSGIYNATSGTYTITGTAAVVTADLDALTFQPSSSFFTTGGSTSFSVQVTDTAGAAAYDTISSVVENGSSGSTLPLPPVAPDAVSINNQVSFDRGTFALTGHVSSAAGVDSVIISASVDGGPVQDLGAATVNPDGSFNFADSVGASQQGFITATETDGKGVVTSSLASFSLEAGLHQGPFRSLQTTYTPDGSAEASVTQFRGDGSRVVSVEAPGQTLHSDFFDTFRNNGTPDSTFVFDPGHGLDVVGQFRVGGADHDTVSLSGSDFGNSIATVLRNAANMAGGVTIIDPATGDAVKLAGITKAQLVHNQADFTFHA